MRNPSDPKTSPVLKPGHVEFRFSRENYLTTLDDLGTGIFLFIPEGRFGPGGPAVLPLPRYRRRTRDGRHVA
jgi:hypothetical protein